MASYSSPYLASCVALSEWTRRPGPPSQEAGWHVRVASPEGQLPQAGGRPLACHSGRQGPQCAPVALLPRSLLLVATVRPAGSLSHSLPGLDLEPNTADDSAESHTLVTWFRTSRKPPALPSQWKRL